MKNILIIDTLDVGAEYTAQAIKLLGYNPIFIFNQVAYQGDTLLQIKKYQHYHMLRTNDPQSIFELIQEKNILDIAAVVSLADSRLKTVADLSKILNIPGNDPACGNFLYSKEKVQNLIPDFCAPAISLDKRDGIQKLKDFFQQYKKIVVKPNASAGGVGLQILENETELEAFSNLLLTNQIDMDACIAQAFVEGILISLEGFVSKGKISYIGFSRRYKYKNTESINLFPFKVDLKIAEKAKNAVADLARFSGYRNGYFHTEFIMTSDSCYLIDANFGRVGGGGLSQQFAIAFDRTPVEIYQHIIDITLFEGQNSDVAFYKKRPINTLSVQYGVQAASVVYQVNSLSKKNFYHTKLIDDYGFALPYGANNLSWMGIAAGKGGELLFLLDEIEIVTKQGSQKPFYSVLSSNIHEEERLLQQDFADLETWDCIVGIIPAMTFDKEIK